MEALNIHSRSSDERARKLSNFSVHGFRLDGDALASVEGFIQGIKFPKGHPNRIEAFNSTGMKAKKLGETAERKSIWWKSYTCAYGSPEHHRLLAVAIRAKFVQNHDAMEALLATEGLALTHDTGEPEPSNTSLPAQIFCDILTNIREEYLKTRK